MADSTAKSALEKMRLKPGMSALIYGQPDGLAAVAALPEGALWAGAGPMLAGDEEFERALGAADFVVGFASDQAQAEQRIAEVSPAIERGAVVWLAYPKGSKAAGHDVSRDTIWRAANRVGFVLNSNIAVDDVWSAVRFRVARPDER